MENEQFCPTCGQWVDPLEEDEEGFEEFTLGSEPPPYEDEGWTSPVVSVPSQTVACPSCGAANPGTNRHCEECGARLSQGPLPVAPQPAMGTSAGLRAVIAVSGVLIVVFIVAAIFNAIRGNGEAGAIDATSTVPDTTLAEAPAQMVVPIDVECSSVAQGFDCEDLVNGSAKGWNDDALQGENARVVFTFAPAVALEQIVFVNTDDPVRFKRNFRVQGYTIEADDFDLPIAADTLPDETGSHVINVATLRTTRLIFSVDSTYAAEAVSDQTPFDTLLIEGFEFIGRPVSNGGAGVTPTTAPEETTTTEG